MSEALPLSRLMEAVGGLDGILERASVEAPAPAEAESAGDFLDVLRTATLLLDAPLQPAAAAVADLLTELDPEAPPPGQGFPAPGASELTQLMEPDLIRLAVSQRLTGIATDPALGSTESGSTSGSAALQPTSAPEALAQSVTQTATGPSVEALAPVDTGTSGNADAGPDGPSSPGGSASALQAAAGQLEQGDTSERSAGRLPELLELSDLPDAPVRSQSGDPADDPRSPDAVRQVAIAAPHESSAQGAGQARPAPAAPMRPDAIPQQQAAPEAEARTESAARTSAGDSPRAFDSSAQGGNDSGRETPPRASAELPELGSQTGPRTTQDASSSSAPQGHLTSAPQAQSAPQDVAPTREPRALPELPVQNETEIIREARLLTQAGGGQARIQLHPPQLGELSLRIAVTDQSVSVSFVAEHAQIADVLARHLPELRQALEGMGLRIDSLQLDARTAGDEADEFGSRSSTGERETPDGLRKDLSGPPAELLPTLPHVPPSSLGTVDVTI